MRRRNGSNSSRRTSAMSTGWVEDTHGDEQQEPLLGSERDGGGRPAPAADDERVYPDAYAHPPPSHSNRQQRSSGSRFAWFTACCGMNCCGWARGVGGRRSGGSAEIQSYSDFALLSELPVIETIRQSLAERCQFAENEDHEQQLQRLRLSLRPRSGEQDGGDFDWRTLGFQSANSRTDFRGAGLAGLRCLCHLADHYPDEYNRYLALSDQEQREDGGGPGSVSYPCSASALAMVLVLVYRLKLTVRPPLMSPDCGTDIQNPSPIDRDDLRTVLRLLMEERSQSTDTERVFRELFCAAVYVMHSVWVSQPRQELDIMNFNKLTYLPAWEAVQRALLDPAAVDGTQSLEEICAAIRTSADRM